MSRRVVVSLLLLVAILPLLGLLSSAPETQGQAFTTITTYTTKLTTITSARVTIIPLTSTTTVTRSDMTTSSLTPPRKLFSETIVITKPRPKYCNVDTRAFSAKKGEVLSTNIESSSEFSLYLFTEKDYKKWQKTGHCSPGEVSDFTGAFDITSYNEQLVMANDDWYRFVLINYGPESAVIKFKAEIVGVTYETTSVVTSHVVSLRYSTDTLTLTTVATGTVVRTEQVGLPLGQNSMLIIAVIVVAAVAVVAVVVLRRRGQGKPAATAAIGAPVESQFAAKRFCISCGAELPAEVNFCNKCGTKQ